jgi:DNA polymerase-4
MEAPGSTTGGCREAAAGAHPILSEKPGWLLGRSARYTRSMESFSSQPWMGRAILHADMDAFFAAIEQLDHPKWRGKPVIVGGSSKGRGVVSTASYEARRFGVHSAMASALAEQLCPDAIWAGPRFDRYQEIAAAVRTIFRDETPFVQPVSIDEAYLDVSPGRIAAEDPVEIARRIKRRISELGVTASVGVATSRSVAKIGSDFDKPDGLTVVLPGTEAAFLAPLPVRAMIGIGPRSAERLIAHGVRTIGDVAKLDAATAEALLGSHGPGLVLRACGIDDSPVTANDPAKSVSAERTFAEDVRTPAEVEDALASLAARVGRRLRRKGMAGRTVTVKLRFSDFTTRTVRRTLDSASNDETRFGPIAYELARNAWHPGVGLRLLGIGLSGFDERSEQLDLLADESEEASDDLEASASAPSRRRDRLVRGLDAVRERFGEDAVRFGRELKPGAGPSDTSDSAPAPRPEDREDFR